MADAKPNPSDLTDADYITRRDALIEGDDGVLPSGQTCAQARAAYEQLAIGAPQNGAAK